jgi:carbamoyltransferase
MDSSFGAIEANSLIARGVGNKLWSVECPGLMIGVGYAIFTKYLGLGPPLYKAGTTMGLASYGKPNLELLSNIDTYVKESYFSDSTYEKYYSNLFLKWSKSNRQLTKEESSKPEAMMLAASIQYLFENCLLDVLNNKIKIDDTDNLCLAGGSLLNCNANSVIKQKSRFKNVHHFPACGDDGICVGAALYTAHHLNDEPRHDYKINEICYLGRSQEVVEPDYTRLAKMISDGKIIAWFMGKSEYGPRALGNRSIIADPRNFHNRELINFVIKNREWFRPFAPAVLEEHYQEWFEFDSISPYMLYTAKVLRPTDIPAVTHIDGSARFQTVNKDSNIYFYKLISEFYKLTGVPILMNTSLNGNGQPILETEQDALDFFQSSNVDALIINGKILEK